MSKYDDEVLVRVEGVSKKFCRSLKKSLWYGVCDIASELNPFGRNAAYANSNKNLTTIEHGGRCEKEQPKVGPKGAAPEGRRKSKYLHQWLQARTLEKGNRPEDRRDHRLCRDSGIHRHAGAELFLRYDRALVLNLGSSYSGHFKGDCC